MPRFLSAGWFEEVASHAPFPDAAEDAPTNDRLVLRQVVRATPDGDVQYHVVVGQDGARIIPPGREQDRPDLTITTDWETAAAIAQGKLASQAALIEGRLRVKGNLAALAAHAGGLAGTDPVPPAVRDNTTY